MSAKSAGTVLDRGVSEQRWNSFAGSAGKMAGTVLDGNGRQSVGKDEFWCADLIIFGSFALMSGSVAWSAVTERKDGTVHLVLPEAGVF